MEIYSIKDIIPEVKECAQYYLDVFEETAYPDIEWPHSPFILFSCLVYERKRN